MGVQINRTLFYSFIELCGLQSSCLETIRLLTLPLSVRLHAEVEEEDDKKEDDKEEDEEEELPLNTSTTCDCNPENKNEVVTPEAHNYVSQIVA